MLDEDCGVLGVCTAYSLQTSTGNSTSEPVCVLSCERESDCPEGRHCTYNGNPLSNVFDRICEEAVGANLLLSSCSIDAECQSGLCVLDVCSAPCVENVDCPGGTCEAFSLAAPLGAPDLSERFCQ
ncbi:MAG: hypothetical protein GY822_08700 [Deltaproteobacteria bacterium]|nr:hypothetical protein [Deltaproteobacteria bacterium]